MRFILIALISLFPVFASAACGPFATASIQNYIQPGITTELAEAVLFPSPAYAFTESFSLDSVGLSSLDNLKGYFTCRIEQLHRELKATSLFGVANSLQVASMSGDSAFTFDAGQFGTLSYDYSTNIPPFGFIILKTVLMSLSVFYAVSLFVKGAS